MDSRCQGDAMDSRYSPFCGGKKWMRRGAQEEKSSQRAGDSRVPHGCEGGRVDLSAVG